ncbi:hypothetical protein JCM10908_002942 [Rhodotorula pacifica]|uniref:ubiquinol-cytochrome c reductase complex assembly factor 2 n=1 Tax=Rhodotorula pacifica TaxID=1495444 RepID=UPI0031732021
MSTASNASLRQAWHAAASAWPRDPLRPKLQFADAIRTAADRALADKAPLSDTQVWKAREAVAAMQRLVHNKALEKYPVTQRTTKPASFPKHYSRIVDTIERAERGEVFKKPGWFRFRFS